MSRENDSATSRSLHVRPGSQAQALSPADFPPEDHPIDRGGARKPTPGADPGEEYAATGSASATGDDQRIQLCGAVSARILGQSLDGVLSGDRARLCLSYLALNRDRPVRRDELITAIWPDDLPQNPGAALATLLSRMRRALGPDAIEGRAELRLALPDGVRIDVEEAEAAVSQAEGRLAAGDLLGAGAAASAALEILDRELLPGLEGEWIERERERLEGLRLRALECRGEAALARGGPALATAERAAHELTAISPYRESAHRLLMRALGARGDAAEALAAYESLRELLLDELGTTPAPDTAELHRRLLEGEGEGRGEEEAGRPLSGTLTIVTAELVEDERPAGPVDEQTAAAVRVTGLQLIRDAAKTSQGRELQASGDGVVLAFDSVLRALTCATLIEQFVAHHARLNPDRAIAVRCGISVGEASSEEEALVGEAAAAARALCRRAGPEQILASELVAGLAGTMAEHELAPIEPGEAGEPGAHELRWRSAGGDPTGIGFGGDPGGAQVTELDGVAVGALERTLELCGITDPRLGDRYSIIFAYPGQGIGDIHLELSGCTTEICAILEETATFGQHGIHVVGLSTEPSVPPAGCEAITFPTGVIPQDLLGEVLPAVDRGERRYAARTSFVVFPDRTGVRITEVRDVLAHVRNSFDLAVRRRLAGYRDAAITHLAGGSSLRSSVGVRELLAPGADSVGIPRVEVTFDLVSKLAAPEVIASEAGYIDRINRLLSEHGRERLFPQVVAICTEEDPAWYLMEAVNPVPLDRLAFEDDARTTLGAEGRELLAGVLERVSGLYELTLRREVPRVARYHYLGRFADVPRREDARTTFASLVGGELDSMLARELVVDGYPCRSYREQLGFLERNLDALLQPVGAYVHGDLHLPNMLLSEAGDRVVLIDPRVVWDGNDVGDPGFCDPVYDLATLLHSLHAMSAILRAIETGTTEALLDREDPGGAERLVIRPGVLRLHDNPVVAWFTEWVEHAVPEGVLGGSWRARLHVGAANALLGWLKYAGAIQTDDAWIATYAAALYHLERGRRELEGEWGRKGDA